MDGYSKELIDEKFKVVNHRLDDLETEVKDTKGLITAIGGIDKKVDILAENTNGKFNLINEKLDNLNNGVNNVQTHQEKEKDIKINRVRNFLDSFWGKIVSGVALFILGAWLALLNK